MTSLSLARPPPPTHRSITNIKTSRLQTHDALQSKRTRPELPVTSHLQLLIDANAASLPLLCEKPFSAARNVFQKTGLSVYIKRDKYLSLNPAARHEDGADVTPAFSSRTTANY